MFFSKISFLAAAFVAGVSMSGAFAELQVGDLCVGFTGPVNDTCVEGSTCCDVYADYSLCANVGEAGCSSSFLEEGVFCSGAEGPVGECMPGTTCCYTQKDHAECVALPPFRACPRIAL